MLSQELNRHIVVRTAKTFPSPSSAECSGWVFSLFCVCTKLVRASRFRHYTCHPPIFIMQTEVTYQIRNAYFKEQRLFSQKQIRGENKNFDIQAKGQGHTEVLNVCNTSPHGETLM